MNTKTHKIIIPHNTYYALYVMSNNFLIFTLKEFRAPYICSHLYLYLDRLVNPPGVMTWHVLQIGIRVGSSFNY